MGLQNQKISSGQVKWLIVGFLLGGTILTDPGSNAGHIGWLAIIIGLIYGFLISIIFLELSKRFPNQSPIQYNQKLFGVYLGYLVSLGQILIALSVTVVIVKDFLIFFTIVLPETPQTAFAIPMVLILSYTALKGVEAFSRSAHVLVPVSIVMIYFVTSLAVPLLDYYKILPLTIDSPRLFWRTTLSIISFPFSEMVVFLMILPMVADRNKLKHKYLSGLLLGTLTLLIVSIRNIAVFGNGIATMMFPSISLARCISLGDVLTRFEIFVGLSFNLLGFVATCVSFYAMVSSTAELLKLDSYKVVILPSAFLIFVFAMQTPSNLEFISWFDAYIWPYITLLFGLFFPLIGLIRSKILNLGS